MWVRATEMGYYDHKRRREGAVFELKPITRKRTGKDGVEKEVTIRPEQQFSSRWMEKLPEGQIPRAETTGDKPVFAPGAVPRKGRSEE